MVEMSYQMSILGAILVLQVCIPILCQTQGAVFSGR
jgi:hypothetical protein